MSAAFLAFLLTAAACAAPGIDLNPASPLVAGEKARPELGSGQVRLKHGRFEAELKATSVADEKAARQLMKAETHSVRDLYQARITPYAGELSSLTECPAGLRPEEFSFELGGETVRGILGGASARRAFGACTPETIGYLGAYYLIYDSKASRVLEVRIFDRNGKGAHALRARGAELIRVASALLQAGK